MGEWTSTWVEGTEWTSTEGQWTSTDGMGENNLMRGNNLSTERK